MPREIRNNLKEGDMLIVKDGKYVPYNTDAYLGEKVPELLNKDNFVNLPNDSTYVMLDFTEDELYLQNTKTGDSIYIDREGYPNYEIGDFLTVKDSKLIEYEGVIDIGSEDVLKSIKRLYDAEVNL